ncbi:MAG: hypothetical protein ABIQ90_13955, partial [Polaromonas sp.]
MFYRSNKTQAPIHPNRTACKKAPVKGLAIRGDSTGGKPRTRVPESVVEPGWRWQASGNPIQPRPGAGPETQAAGAAEHGLRGAAQYAQALLVELVKNSAG